MIFHHVQSLILIMALFIPSSDTLQQVHLLSLQKGFTLHHFLRRRLSEHARLSIALARLHSKSASLLE